MQHLENALQRPQRNTLEKEVFAEDTFVPFFCFQRTLKSDAHVWTRLLLTRVTISCYLIFQHHWRKENPNSTVTQNPYQACPDVCITFKCPLETKKKGKKSVLWKHVRCVEVYLHGFFLMCCVVVFSKCCMCVVAVVLQCSEVPRFHNIDLHSLLLLYSWLSCLLSVITATCLSFCH